MAELSDIVLTWRFADMKEHFVIDPLISKRQQLLLATQLCRMVLKVRIVTFLFGDIRHTPLGVIPFPAIPSAIPSIRATSLS